MQSLRVSSKSSPRVMAVRHSWGGSDHEAVKPPERVQQQAADQGPKSFIDVAVIKTGRQALPAVCGLSRRVSPCVLKEHDELDACCQKAPNWEKEVIMRLAYA